MKKELIKQRSTKRLQSDQKFSNFALNAVYLGISFSLLVSGYRFMVDGIFPTYTVIFALFAFLLSIPVYKEKQLITEVLENRI